MARNGRKRRVAVRSASGHILKEFRKEYGKDLLMFGGIDKRSLARGERAIDEGLRRIAPMIVQGGCIPWLDHSVPPDISFDYFLYYMDGLAKLCSGKL